MITNKYNFLELALHTFRKRKNNLTKFSVNVRGHKSDILLYLRGDITRSVIANYH